jgi:hypothetical protein
MLTPGQFVLGLVAGSQRTLSYMMSRISRKVRLLCWNHEPCLMDTVPRHLAPAILFQHRHLNPSGRFGSVHHVVSRPQVFHGTLLRIKPTSFSNWMASVWSLKRYVRKIFFGALSARSVPRPYENLGTICILRKSSSYPATTFLICSTIIFFEEKNYIQNVHNQWLLTALPKLLAL